MTDPMMRKLARQLVSVDKRLHNLETVPQLAHSSIDDSALPVYDKDGNLVAKVGKQDDGTWGAPPLSGPTPPMPRGLQALGGPGTIHVTWSGEFSEGAACPLDFDVLEVLVDGALSGSISNRDGGSVSISSPSGQHYVSARIRTLVPRHSETTSPFSVEVGPPADQLFIDAKEEIDGAKEEIAGAKQEIADERAAREGALAEAQEELTRLDQELSKLPTSAALEEVREGLGNALSAAEAAEREASEARTSAEAAIADALAAVGIARDKGRIYYQPTAPTDTEAKSPNNLWIDSDDGKVYVWNGSAWEESQSEDLRDAAQAAAAALAAAEAAEAKAQAAANAAATAQAAAEAAQSTADQATIDARGAWNGAVAAQAAADDALEKYGPLDQRTIDAQEAADAAQARADAALAEASEAKGLAEEAVREVGDTVRDTVIEYAVNTSETSAPTSGWSASTPTRTPGSFVWMRTVVTYADGDTSTTSPALLTGNAGAKGDPGEKGDPGDRGADGVAGKDGVGLSGTALAYALSTSGTTAPSSGWTANPPTPIKGRYLWTRTTWTYTDSSTETGYSVAYLATDGAKGNDGIAGKDGVGIKSTAITYAASSSGTTAPSSGWSSQPPAASAGQYVWTRTVWTYTDNSTETGYSVGKIGDTGSKGATGSKGDKGDKGDTGSTGDQGVSVSSVDPFFRTVSRSSGAPAQPSGMTPSGWSTTEPAWSSNTKLYRAERIVYSNGTVSWTVPTLVAAYEGIVQVQTSVNGKNSITRSTSNASGTGVAAGDAWYKVDSNGDTMAMWIWDGSKWVASKVRNEMIDTVDVNKLKVHDRLEVIGDAVIDKIWADGIAAKAITSSRIVVANSSESIIPNSLLLEDQEFWTGSGATERVAIAGVEGVTHALRSSKGSGTVSPYNGPSFPVTPGGTYLFEFWMRADVAGSNIFIELRDQDGNHASGRTVQGAKGPNRQLSPNPSSETNYLIGSEPVPIAWTKYQVQVNMNTTTTSARVASFYFNHNGGSVHNAQVWVAGMSLRSMASAVLIEDGAVGADKIIADEVAAEVSNLVEARVEKLKVTAGATINEAVILKLATEMITAGVLRTAAEGQRVVIDESGIVMYGVDPDGVEFELVRIGPSGDNLITAGDTSISPEGVQAPSGTFDEIAVGGEDLSEILWPLPRGVVARGWNEIGGRSIGPTGETELGEITVPVEDGRSYALKVEPFSVYLPTGGRLGLNIYIEKGFGGNPAPAPTLSSRLYRSVVWRDSGGDRPMIVAQGNWLAWEDEDATEWRLLFAVSVWGSNTAGAIYDNSRPYSAALAVSVEDVGPFAESIMTDRSGSTAAPKPPPPAPKRYKKTYTSTSFHTYDNNGNETSDADVVQGLYAGGPSRLRRRGGWKFPSFTSDLSGATVEKIEVYVYMNHSYYTAGADVNIATHNGNVSNSLTSRVTVRGWKRNTGKWITLPKSLYNGFRNGTYQGVGVISTNSTAQQYARFNGSGAKIRVTYVK